MPTTHFSDDEMEQLAERIAIHLLPMLVQTLKDKATWTVNQLQGEHFTVKQVAEQFQISRQTVYRLAKEDRIDSEKVGKGSVRFTRNAIEKAQREGWLP